jgi:hypothetical protein
MTMEENTYPLSQINLSFDKLNKAKKYLLIIDLIIGYWQVLLTK